MAQIVYLHGFASGPLSAKAKALAPRFEAAGHVVQTPDLNLPRFERLRVQAMVRHVEELVARAGETILVGSSLGALVALHVQARCPEVKGVVLLAPALEADRRWLQLIGGEPGLREWRTSGRRCFHHYAYGRDVPIDVAFLDDLLAHATPPPLRVPAEVVQGQRDVQVTPDVARRFAEREPDQARLALVDDDHSLLAPASLDEIVAAVGRVMERMAG